MHQGGTWSTDGSIWTSSDNHTDIKKCDHPNIGCTLGSNSDAAMQDTKVMLQAIQDNAREFNFNKFTNGKTIPIGGDNIYKTKKYIKEGTGNEKNHIQVKTPRYSH